MYVISAAVAAQRETKKGQPAQVSEKKLLERNESATGNWRRLLPLPMSCCEIDECVAITSAKITASGTTPITATATITIATTATTVLANSLHTFYNQ